MRICFVTTGDIISLATMKRATGMAEPLFDAKNEVAIVALNCQNNRDRFQLECPDATILWFDGGNVKHELIQKKQLLKSWMPDIVYVCSFGVRNLIHKKNIKLSDAIFLVEQSELRSAIKNNKWYKRILEWLLEWATIFLFDGQIAASRYLEDLYLKKNKIFFKKQPILYSPYAYNSKLLLPDIDLEKKLKGKFYGKKVILYMGTLSLNYGFLDILNAAKLLSKKRNDFVVLIAGNGRHKKVGEEFRKSEHLEQIVYFLHYVPEKEISTYFNIADVFISPLYNTVQDIARCPSKLFMYLPFNKPVITAEIGEAKELFGDKGYYYTPGDIKNLALMIDNVIKTRPLSCNVEAEKHSWEYRTQEFLTWVKKEFTKS